MSAGDLTQTDAKASAETMLINIVSDVCKIYDIYVEWHNKI